MSEFQTIQLEIDPRGVATLWLDRAEKNNAFNAVVIDELLQAIDRVGSDPQVRLLVLRGRGRHFCGGADLAWMQQSVDLDYQGNLADAQRIAELMTHLYNLPKPTLAVVQGAVFGGGVGLVSCCDMAIGSDDATFCLSEVRIGLIPATIAPFVVKAIGQRRAALFADRRALRRTPRQRTGPAQRKLSRRRTGKPGRGLDRQPAAKQPARPGRLQGALP